MISITTIDELAHIMNGDLVDYLSDLNLYHRINAKVYTVQIITGSNIVSTTLAFCSRKLFYIPKWNNLYEEKLQTNFFAGSSP